MVRLGSARDRAGEGLELGDVRGSVLGARRRRVQLEVMTAPGDPRPIVGILAIQSNHSIVWCRVSEAMNTATMVTSAMAMIYDASAPRPYGSSAVAINGERPPAITDEN
jgi:hypothetical protein